MNKKMMIIIKYNMVKTVKYNEIINNKKIKQVIINTK